MIDVNCASCGQLILHYQKDGPGWLKRCYLNRIFAPDELEKLQYDKNIKIPSDLSSLVCSRCGEIIGSPVLHKDGRLAFHLERGKFKRKTYK